MQSDVSAMIRRVARGRHGAENLSREQARRLLQHLLAEDADALQLGAFLIAERMKGETAEELAGFVEAARMQMPGFAGEALHAVDLPCYAGKRRAAPVHLLAAMKARDAGIRIVVHGVEVIEGRFSAWQALSDLGVQRAAEGREAAAILDRDGIVYLDLAEICPPLYRLFMLRPRLGVRSFANTVARLLNPMRCAAQLNGIFHTPYAQVMAEVNRLIGQPASLIFAGAEGEPELYATRQRILLWQRGLQIRELTLDDARTEDDRALPTYPKRIRDCPEALREDMLRILRGEPGAYERAALERMRTAFAWADMGLASDAMPAGWRLAGHAENT